MRDGFGLKANDRISVILPFCHIFGLAIAINEHCGGDSDLDVGRCVRSDGVRRRDPTQPRHVRSGPPPTYESLLAMQAAWSYDLSSLHVAFVVWRSSRLRRYPAIVCPDGNDVAQADEPGELLVRAPSTTPGCFDAPEATAAALDAESWLRTGDIGIVDDRGYVRITIRKKDVFIVGGVNASPADIEGILREHPSVGQVAVVGRSNDRLGEVGVVFVVPSDAASFGRDELIAWRENSPATSATSGSRDRRASDDPHDEG